MYSSLCRAVVKLIGLTCAGEVGALAPAPVAGEAVLLGRMVVLEAEPGAAFSLLLL